MLKFINLKKLTTNTIVGIMLATGLVIESSNNSAVARSCSNNGHGNNAPFTHYLDSGKLTIAHYDPTNPGINRSRLIQDLDAGRQTSDLHSNRPFEISYVGYDGSTSYNLTADEAEAIVDSHPDWELSGDKSILSGCSDYDNDGIDDAIEIGGDVYYPVDTDGDGTPDYADTDSDDDGKLDSVEGTVDSNGDGVIDRVQMTGLTVSIEAPTVQTSQLPNPSNYFVVDFNNQSTGTAGFSETNNGTTYTYGSDLDIQNANQWGGAEGSKFITQERKTSIRSYNIKVDQKQKYFGFWWSAGDPYNQITFKNNGNDVAVFKTQDLVDFIQSAGVADTQAYYGNPAYSGGGGHQNEPFSFVNVFFNDLEYDEIVVATLTEGGAAFESDNHTFSATKQTIRGTVITGITSDSDYDGLIDAVDPDPNDSDMDDDGLLDGNDLYPEYSDYDQDGLIDGQDPDPNDDDYDDDGLLDGNDPSPEDASGDADNDGISDANEINPPEGTPETDPNNSDSDDDGLTDGQEVNTYGSDPTAADTDGDTINDYDEVTNGTDPAKVDTDGDSLDDNDSRDPDPTQYDTDGDGIGDGDEEEGDYNGDGEPDYDLQPNGIASDVDGDGIYNNEDLDSDNDGVSDAQEMANGTNPYKQDYVSD